MKIKERIVKAKDGRDITLKNISPSNSLETIAYLKKVYRESEYLTRYEEEFNITEEAESKYLESLINSPSSIFIGAYINEKLIGSIQVDKISNNIKTKHRANLAICVDSAYQGVGVGNQLLGYAIELSKNIGLGQIELEVVSENYGAIHLYEKYGFEKIGVIPRALITKEGKDYDFTLMVLKLS